MKVQTVDLVTVTISAPVSQVLPENVTARERNLNKEVYTGFTVMTVAVENG